ncbi:MAG: hypothetical protein ACJAZT_000454 [Gammaproteobacteria bacterium]|jgi:hypothetical protein
MKSIKPITLLLASLAVILPSSQTFASETLAAHEHGSAHLDIAIDNNVIAFRFESPAVNIVGFEYHPNDEEEKSLISEAKNKLSNFETSFEFQGEPNCKVVRSSANWVSEHSAHDETASEALEAEHAEFIVEFELQCEQISNLTAINVPLFALFPDIHEIDAQVIYIGGQIKQELTSDNTLINLIK